VAVDAATEDDDSMRCLRVVISGQVQGVFFRTTCASLARELGVSGWIRNRPGGDVEAVFEGADEAVDRLVAWCREGPPHARVERVEVSDEPPSGLAGFRITR
jgi:acylphosphatase